jgi:chromosome segregation ATPase
MSEIDQLRNEINQLRGRLAALESRKRSLEDKHGQELRKLRDEWLIESGYASRRALERRLP